MTRKTRELLPTIPLSVTVPHTLDLDDQVKHKSRERDRETERERERDMLIKYVQT